MIPGEINRDNRGTLRIVKLVEGETIHYSLITRWGNRYIVSPVVHTAQSNYLDQRHPKPLNILDSIDGTHYLIRRLTPSQVYYSLLTSWKEHLEVNQGEQCMPRQDFAWQLRNPTRLDEVVTVRSSIDTFQLPREQPYHN